MSVVSMKQLLEAGVHFGHPRAGAASVAEDDADDRLLLGHG